MLDLDGMSSEIRPPPVRHDSASARNLYDLLDTLVAIRLDVDEGAHSAGMATGLSAEETQGVRKLLDRAIASTKNIIEDLTRPIGE